VTWQANRSEVAAASLTFSLMTLTAAMVGSALFQAEFPPQQSHCAEQSEAAIFLGWLGQLILVIDSNRSRVLRLVWPWVQRRRD
jgi:hypothetical protein